MYLSYSSGKFSGDISGKARGIIFAEMLFCQIVPGGERGIGICLSGALITCGDLFFIGQYFLS